MEEITKFQDVAKSVPELIGKNNTRLSNALTAKNALLADIQKVGMSKELDEKCNSYLVRAKKTMEGMKTDREPITQLLSSVNKEFTTLEADLKKAIDEIQEQRNLFAKAELDRQRKEEEAAKNRKLAADEKIELRQKIGIALNKHFEDYLNSEIKKIQFLFDSITLVNMTENQHKMNLMDIDYPLAHFDSFTLNIPTAYTPVDEKKKIKAEVLAGKYEEFNLGFRTEISDIKKSLIDKIPSKVTELKEIEEAEKNNKAEADRLKLLKEQREAEEKAELDRQAKERADKAEAEANQKAQSEKMEVLFETVASVETTQERTGYNMIITHHAAYMQIFALWFELEAKDLGMDQIEKKTMKQMKSFCESYAHKTGTKIESKFIKYEEIVKVRTSK